MEAVSILSIRYPGGIWTATVGLIALAICSPVLARAGDFLLTSDDRELYASALYPSGLATQFESPGASERAWSALTTIGSTQDSSVWPTFIVGQGSASSQLSLAAASDNATSNSVFDVSFDVTEATAVEFDAMLLYYFQNSGSNDVRFTVSLGGPESDVFAYSLLGEELDTFISEPPGFEPSWEQHITYAGVLTPGPYRLVVSVTSIEFISTGYGEFDFTFEGDERVPEPAFGAALASGLIGLAAMASGRSRRLRAA